MWDRFGRSRIDLFATVYSRRRPLFVSPVPDPRTWAIVAMAISRVGLDVYTFPPFALLLRVLRKWESDRPRMILFAPDWPAQG